MLHAAYRGSARANLSVKFLKREMSFLFPHPFSTIGAKSFPLAMHQNYGRKLAALPSPAGQCATICSVPSATHRRAVSGFSPHGRNSGDTDESSLIRKSALPDPGSALSSGAAFVFHCCQAFAVYHTVYRPVKPDRCLFRRATLFRR